MNHIVEEIEFASHAHGKQTRKYSGLPYIQHPIRVCKKLYEYGATGGNPCIYCRAGRCSGKGEKINFASWIDTVGLSAAVCHDVLEDTPVTYEELSKKMGNYIADVVNELTKKEDASLPRAERKRREIERLSTVSCGAKLIKLLDRQDNLEDVLEYGGPAEWVLEYTKESRLLLDTIGSEHPAIKEDIVKLVEQIEKQIKKDIAAENAKDAEIKTIPPIKLKPD